MKIKDIAILSIFAGLMVLFLMYITPFIIEHISYPMLWEGLVIETIKETVRAEALK
jgi:hypothetical protein